jgi:sodium/hydrogen exchanger family protein
VHLDPVLPGFVGLVFILLILALTASAVRQPVIFGYLLSGLLIGPSVLGLVDDVQMIERLGAVGVVLLLFFIGLEVSPRALAAATKAAAIAVHQGDAHQGCDLAAIEGPELGYLGDQRSGRGLADAWHRSEQILGGAPGRSAANDVVEVVRREPATGETTRALVHRCCCLSCPPSISTEQSRDKGMQVQNNDQSLLPFLRSTVR